MHSTQEFIAYRRTIWIPQRVPTFKANSHLKIHNAHLKLVWHISGQQNVPFWYFCTIVIDELFIWSPKSLYIFSDPMGELRKLYDFLKMNLTPKVESAMDACIKTEFKMGSYKTSSFEKNDLFFKDSVAKHFEEYLNLMSKRAGPHLPYLTGSSREQKQAEVWDIYALYMLQFTEFLCDVLMFWLSTFFLWWYVVQWPYLSYFICEVKTKNF